MSSFGKFEILIFCTDFKDIISKKKTIIIIKNGKQGAKLELIVLKILKNSLLNKKALIVYNIF